MILLKKIFLFFKRESKLFYSNIVDLFSNILFFFLSIFVFIFALGTEDQLLRTIGVGIIWSLLLLSSTLSIRKFYEDDFKNGQLWFFKQVFGVHGKGINLISNYNEYLTIRKSLQEKNEIQGPCLLEDLKMRTEKNDFIWDWFIDENGRDLSEINGCSLGSAFVPSLSNLLNTSPLLPNGISNFSSPNTNFSQVISYTVFLPKV